MKSKAARRAAKPLLLARTCQVGIVRVQDGGWVYGPTELVAPTRREIKTAVRTLAHRCPAGHAVRVETVDEYVRHDETGEDAWDR